MYILVFILFLLSVQYIFVILCLIDYPEKSNIRNYPVLIISDNQHSSVYYFYDSPLNRSWINAGLSIVTMKQRKACRIFCVCVCFFVILRLWLWIVWSPGCLCGRYTKEPYNLFPQLTVKLYFKEAHTRLCANT